MPRTRHALLIALALLVPATSAHASFPGQNGRIAFVETAAGCAPPGCSDIYSADPDGTGRVNLTDSPGDDRDPAWSADGTRIAFESNRDGNSEIYVMNADGSELARVTNNAAGDFEPSWAPSGSELVFTSNRDGNEELYKIGIDGTGQMRLTNDQARDHTPDWSPDGRRIAFTSNRSRELWTDVFTMNPDGTDVRLVPLAPAPGECWGGGPDHFHPDWSPSGDKLVLASFGQEECIAEEQVGRIETIQPDGGDRAVVIDDLFFVLDPVWSPDADRIAYFYNDFAEIRTVDADSGANQQTVTTGEQPDWQPLPVVTPSSHVRPRGATPFRVSLVPAMRACNSPNREHGPPLAFPSCAPPQPHSNTLAVSQGDARLRSVGFMRLDVVAGTSGGPEDADVALRFSLSNVMKTSDYSDYAGELRVDVAQELTSRSGSISATSVDVRLDFDVPCAATTDPGLGGACALQTSLDAVRPGLAHEGARTVFEFGAVRVFDGGSDGDVNTESGNTVLATQGVFVP